MNGKANRAEVFMKAFESLSKAEKRVVVSRLLDAPQLREEVAGYWDRSRVRDRAYPTT